jgi:hypothetical protein
MKKVFSFKAPGKADARVVESVKHEVRKYVKREHNKALPDDFDLWTFTCKVGATSDAAVECPLGDVSAKIDEVANSGGIEVYVEIIAVASKHPSSSETPISQ